MLTWKYLDILSYGAGTPSTTLALMSCENAHNGKPYPYPLVPVYDAVIFCEPECYVCALQVDELVKTHQARPPLKSKLFISKSRKRLWDLTAEDCQDAQTFLYQQEPIWNGF